jgi:hypothetical protein
MAFQPPKVFISYNKADRDWAEWIAGVIKGAGYEPILDVWHFRPGENFVLRMQEAATQADLTLAVLSEAYLQAAYTRPEWAAAFAPDPNGKDRRLIPVRVGKCALTGILRSILYIDLIDLSEQNAEQVLLNGLKPSGEPAQPPKFPANRAALGVSVPPFPLNIVRRHGVPDPGVFLPDPPHDFVGRTEALEMLYALLAEEVGSALLYGEPGCGKSTIALKFAWQIRGAFDAVVFQLCSQRPVAEIAAEIATKLKLGVETRSPEEQITAAKAWLAERRALLVLDDIWENDVGAIDPGPPVSLLCTSRRRSLPWISRSHSLNVKSFSHSEAESIFRIYLGDKAVERHRDALLEFAERVERLPIAIVVGADMLRSELDPVPEAAREQRLENLLNQVDELIALLRRAITALPERERRLLNAMPFLRSHDPPAGAATGPSFDLDRRMSGQIFISYRREDSRWLAGRLYDRLTAHFERKQLFMDIDAIALGADFLKVIEKTVGECEVLIAVIGKRWLTSKDEQGGRRLDNPEDFVRTEIATALKRDICVIPVLGDGALMPRSTKLPDDLKLLARRNALQVGDTHFDNDCRRLVAAIERVLEENTAARREREEKERLEAQRRETEKNDRLEAERRREAAPERRTKAARVFIIYSHEDETLRSQLETHLKLLHRQGLISTWHDRKISAGEEWKGKIDENLQAANIILLMVSAAFIASDYCYDLEMKRALERHHSQMARVIPVILRDVDWKSAPFGTLQALPKDGKPVTLWPNRDSAWKDVTIGIKEAVEFLLPR